MNEIYCIISQSSGPYSLYSPELIYLGTDFDKVWSIVCKEMEDFHEHCYKKKEGKYYRPDIKEWFDTWEDLLTSIYDDINDKGKFVLKFTQWNFEEPGYLCIYKRVEE